MITGKYPCGFCGSTNPKDGLCHDVNRNCHGTIPNAVPADKDGDRTWQCPCAAAGHPGRPVQPTRAPAGSSDAHR